MTTVGQTGRHCVGFRTDSFGALLSLESVAMRTMRFWSYIIADLSEGAVRVVDIFVMVEWRVLSRDLFGMVLQVLGSPRVTVSDIKR